MVTYDHKSFLQRYSGKKPVTMYWRDSQILVKSCNAWACAVAREWGSINAQRKVKSSMMPGHAWWFSCSGHGGFVLIARTADVPEFFSKFLQEDAWGYGAYMFEEDCNYAVLQSTYPDITEWSVLSREREWAAQGDWKPERAQQAREMLANPQMLKEQAAKEHNDLAGCLQRWQTPELIGAMSQHICLAAAPAEA